MHFNLPIALTWLRIVLVPVFVGVYYVPDTWLSMTAKNWFAMSIFALAAITDWADGYLARRWGQTSAFGAFLDPVADKLLLTSAFVTLTWLKMIPFWIAAVVVSRDLVLSVGVLVIHVAGGTVQPAPSWLGKMSTAFQMLTVLAAVASFYFKLLPDVPRVLAWITAAFTVASGLQYMIQGLKQLEHSPATGKGA